MDMHDLKIGSYFLYDSDTIGVKLKGIGEVVDIAYDRDDVISNIKVKWLWRPKQHMHAKLEWYSASNMIWWWYLCTVIDEKEKLKLLLTYNFE